MMKSTLAGAAAAALFALAPAAGLAQNETVQTNVTTTTGSPPAAEPRTPAPPPPPPATDPGIPPVTGTDTVITTTTTAPPPVDMALPPIEPINPYANSYNELEMEPLMVEEDEGFDDWGLFGLLGLLGLLGLMRRRERIVYVEREETRVYRAPGDTLPPR